MKKKIIKYLFCCFYLIPAIEVFANKIPPKPKNADGQPGLPIDNYIYLVMFIGIVLAVYFLKRKKSTI